MVGLPFQSSRHIEQVSHQRKFFRTRGKRKTLPSVLPTKEKRRKERNDSEEVKNDHIWRPAEERDKQFKELRIARNFIGCIVHYQLME